MSRSTGALDQMRVWLSTGAWPVGSRIPPERDLAEKLGVSRGVLRTALAELEAEGRIWRHVGKGTFVGARPAGGADQLAALADRTSPAEVLGTRLILEPSAARLAALHATPAQIAEMRLCLARTRSATTFQHYVVWDNRFHVAIALATKNTLLTSFIETLNVIRRTVVWARLREKEKPSPDNPSLDEHDRIVDAIENRQPDAAEAAMLQHLSRVEGELLLKQYGP